MRVYYVTYGLRHVVSHAIVKRGETPLEAVLRSLKTRWGLPPDAKLVKTKKRPPDWEGRGQLYRIAGTEAYFEILPAPPNG